MYNVHISKLIFLKIANTTCYLGQTTCYLAKTTCYLAKSSCYLAKTTYYPQRQHITHKDDILPCKDDMLLCKDVMFFCKNDILPCKEDMLPCKDDMLFCKDHAFLQRRHVSCSQTMPLAISFTHSGLHYKPFITKHCCRTKSLHFESLNIFKTRIFEKQFSFTFCLETLMIVKTFKVEKVNFLC